MNSGSIYLGTSGWTYEHWKGVFYPDDVPKKLWFEYFGGRFDTVELNASFYRIPTVKATESWMKRSSDTFRFSVKMSRLITHVKKLGDCQREIDWFFSVFEPLFPKIAIFLVQLPPSLKFDLARLENFFGYLKSNTRYAFEFRNTSWYRDETYELLKKYGYSFCIHDMGGLATERIVSSESIYIRFHGFDSRYGGDYPDNILEEWAAWIRRQTEDGKKIFGYFNNDIGGFAAKNCLTLRSMLQGGNRLPFAA